jgi:hypothetical protein
MVVIKSTHNAGKIIVKASSDGLKSATIELDSK